MEKLKKIVLGIGIVAVVVAIADVIYKVIAKVLEVDSWDTPFNRSTLDEDTDEQWDEDIASEFCDEDTYDEKFSSWDSEEDDFPDEEPIVTDDAKSSESLEDYFD